MRTLVATAVLLLLIGCDPDPMEPDSSQAVSDGSEAPFPAFHRVSGDGRFRSAYFGGWFSVRMSATMSAEGLEGWIELKGPEGSAALGGPIPVEVSCLSVSGTQAWVGARVTSGVLSGWGLVFGVRDNVEAGEGLDQRSLLELNATGYADCLTFHPIIDEVFRTGDFKVG